MDRPDCPVNAERRLAQSGCRWWSSMAWTRSPPRPRRRQPRTRWLSPVRPTITARLTASDLAKDMIMTRSRTNLPLLVQVISFFVRPTFDLLLIKVAIVVVQSSIARLMSYWPRTNTGTFRSSSCATPPKKSCPSWLIGCLISPACSTISAYHVTNSYPIFTHSNRATNQSPIITQLTLPTSSNQSGV